MDIKNIELTEEDFKLLVEALDVLPDKSLDGQVMSSIFISMMPPEQRDEAKRQRDSAHKKAKDEADALRENIRILQAKLILFKRYLLEQGALKQTEDILNR